MGIPSFFRHIVVRYNQDVVESVCKTRYVKGLSCTRLFIDFNCILHKCAHQVASQFTTIPKEMLEEMIMNDSIRYVEYLQSIVKPSDLTYIAIDGACPRAKMVQQRKRRYVSSMRKRLVENNPDYQKSINVEWNSNAITPGTKFMTDFDRKIRSFYKDKNDVFISGSEEFGEGEHKIYNHIRQGEKPDDNNNDIIYGLDADLILLSLLNLHQGSTIRLLREIPEFGGYQALRPSDEFCLLNINNLKQAIETYYHVNPINEVSNTNLLYKESNINLPPYQDEKQFMRDYVILCTFLGNDFLPPLSYVKVKNDGIDYIIQIYREVISQTGEYLVDHQGAINDKVLLKIFKAFSISEDENMLNACTQYFTRRTPYTNLQSYHRTLWEMDNYPSIHKMNQNTINPSKKGWRSQYYNTLFGKDLVVTELCKNYLEGLKWVVDYYVKQEPLLDWHYKYSYSPTILDLMNHIQYEMQNNSINDLLHVAKPRSDFLSNETFTRIMSIGTLQLFLVLPPCSKYLIPNERQANIMTDLSLGCLHFFPTEFKITTFLKTFIWECSAILPDVDIQYLSERLLECVA